MKFKRIVQSISYLPYFISWVVVSVMAYSWLSPSSGFINNILVSLHILKEPYFFLGNPDAFWWTALFIDIWKNIGFGSIIYLSAIAGINRELYEAAIVDGANRFRRIWHITIPSILGTIMIMWILNVGALLGGGLTGSNFSESFLLGNALNQSRSEILDVYILKVGLSLGRFSYATAVGLILSCFSAILLFLANFSSKKLSGESFF